MSVIVEMPDKSIRILSKGADNIITSKLSSKTLYLRKTKEYLSEFSKKGLRTLMIAHKEISRDIYNDWNEKYIVIYKSLK